MPDIGWMELLVIGVVALIVVGPKDLPMMFRRLGQFTGRIRAMARDFQRAMDEAADETGMTDLNRDLRNGREIHAQPGQGGDGRAEGRVRRYRPRQVSRRQRDARSCGKAQSGRRGREGQGRRAQGGARGGRRPGSARRCRPVTPNLPRPGLLRRSPPPPRRTVERTGTGGS
jgi:sec-independent protein translocase protein TatB